MQKFIFQWFLNDVMQVMYEITKMIKWNKNILMKFSQVYVNIFCNKFCVLIPINYLRPTEFILNKLII